MCQDGKCLILNTKAARKGKCSNEQISLHYLEVSSSLRPLLKCSRNRLLWIHSCCLVSFVAFPWVCILDSNFRKWKQSNLPGKVRQERWTGAKKTSGLVCPRHRCAFWGCAYWLLVKSLHSSCSTHCFCNPDSLLSSQLQKLYATFTGVLSHVARAILFSTDWNPFVVPTVWFIQTPHKATSSKQLQTMLNYLKWSDKVSYRFNVTWNIS